jgi:hypothetical protein
MRIIIHLFLLFCLGCGSAQTVTTRTPLYKYRADVRITTQGKSINGMISVPRAEGPVRIQIDSPVKMDLVRVSSCNRDWLAEKVTKRVGWWNEVGTQLIFDYEPNDVEEERFCPAYIQVFDDKLLTSWGFVGFVSTEKLKARVSCNGDEYHTIGLDSCQSLYGFEQGLQFQVPVKYVTRGPCAVTKKDEYNLRVRATAPGFCLVTVCEADKCTTEPEKGFKFVLLGYEEILIRGREPLKSDSGGFP